MPGDSDLTVPSWAIRAGVFIIPFIVALEGWQTFTLARISALQEHPAIEIKLDHMSHKLDTLTRRLESTNAGN